MPQREAAQVEPELRALFLDAPDAAVKASNELYDELRQRVGIGLTEAKKAAHPRRPRGPPAAIRSPHRHARELPGRSGISSRRAAGRAENMAGLAALKPPARPRSVTSGRRPYLLTAAVRPTAAGHDPADDHRLISGVPLTERSGGSVHRRQGQHQACIAETIGGHRQQTGPGDGHAPREPAAPGHLSVPTDRDPRARLSLVLVIEWLHLRTA